MTSATRIVWVLSAAKAVLTLMAISVFALQMPQTTTSQTRGATTTATEQLRGTVVQVDPATNDLLVRMSTGELRNFIVPPSRRFLIDGKSLSLGDLKPGTSLKATTITDTTPVTNRTTTVGSGKVFYVSGNTVILTLPNGENKMYQVQDSYRFNVNGQQASVHDLRKGMIVSAQKIVEEPATEIASNTVVTGEAPPQPVRAKVEPALPAQPRQMAAAAPPPAPMAAPAPAPPAPAPARMPTTLPQTATPIPLIGLLGLLLVGTSLSLRKLNGDSA